MTDTPQTPQASQTPEGALQPGAAHLDRAVFADYLIRTRWYGGKGRPFEVTDIRAVGEVPGRVDDSPYVVVYLVEVTYGDTAPSAPAERELYQVPLALYEHPQGRLDHAFVGWWEDPAYGWVHAYDALHDREAMACWLRSFDAAATAPQLSHGSGLEFHRLPGHALDLTAHSTLFAGEQSNSSVAYGEDSLMKVFRKVTPGRNPDIGIHEVLTNAGSQHVAPLLGWLDAVDPAATGGDPGSDPEDESADAEDAADGAAGVLQLAMLQRFLRTATDGWDLALASVRTLFAEPDQHATDSGGDFAGEATRLGEALAEVHAVLAQHFPTHALGPDETAELARGMTQRLEQAMVVVPGLAEHAETLRDIFGRVALLDDLQVQTIHGDLHLGQTLRTSRGWKIVDFEGEPAKPLAERVRPDSRWRDVAGMLRSFDYAPHSVIHSMPQVEDAEQLHLRAVEWVNRNRNFFLVAYAGDLTPAQHTLLDAYVADKAVYECVYEARNRPTWVDIPLAAIARIGASQ